MKSIEIDTKLFFTAFSLILAYSFIGSESVFGVFLKNLTYFSQIIFVWLFIKNIFRYKKIELLVILGFTFLFLGISINTQDYSIFKLMLFTLAFKNIDFNSCIKYDVWLRVFLIIIIYVFYTLGYLSDNLSNRGDEFGIIRHSYGFANPNALALAVSICCMEFLYTYQKHYLKLKGFFILLVMLFVTMVTDSRTSLYAVILFMLLFFVNLYIPNLVRNKLFVTGVKITPTILAILIAIMVSAFVENPFDQKSVFYDKILSGRLDIAASYAKLFSPELFGNNLSMNSFVDRSLDNAYVSMYLSSGIIISVLFLIGYWKLINRLYKANNMVMIFILFCFTIMGVGEKIMLCVDYNLLMILFGTLFYNKYNYHSNS